jgi:hypothetical protein
VKLKEHISALELARDKLTGQLADKDKVIGTLTEELKQKSEVQNKVDLLSSDLFKKTK